MTDSNSIEFSQEYSLWKEWVGVVCGYDNIEPPARAEMEYLRSRFYSGKAPVDSVQELKAHRNNGD